MDVKQAVDAAKDYVATLFADEELLNLGLEETEHDEGSGKWMITLAFSRPWNTPRTRAQEVLENLGALSSLRRSCKVITIADNGHVISMKDRPPSPASD
jgi:hypothetical protein